MILTMRLARAIAVDVKVFSRLARWEKVLMEIRGFFRHPRRCVSYKKY